MWVSFIRIITTNPLPFLPPSCPLSLLLTLPSFPPSFLPSLSLCSLSIMSCSPLSLSPLMTVSNHYQFSILLCVFPPFCNILFTFYSSFLFSSFYIIYFWCFSSIFFILFSMCFSTSHPIFSFPPPFFLFRSSFFLSFLPPFIHASVYFPHPPYLYFLLFTLLHVFLPFSSSPSLSLSNLFPAFHLPTFLISHPSPILSPCLYPPSLPLPSPHSPLMLNNNDTFPPSPNTVLI